MQMRVGTAHCGCTQAPRGPVKKVARGRQAAAHPAGPHGLPQVPEGRLQRPAPRHAWRRATQACSDAPGRSAAGRGAAARALT